MVKVKALSPFPFLLLFLPLSSVPLLTGGLLDGNNSYSSHSLTVPRQACSSGPCRGRDGAGDRAALLRRQTFAPFSGCTHAQRRLLCLNRPRNGSAAASATRRSLMRRLQRAPSAHCAILRRPTLRMPNLRYRFRRRLWPTFSIGHWRFT